jgi:hypothetical protein
VPFQITEADIEKIIANNYWKIFHGDDAEPDYLKVYRQVQIAPYGVADIIAVSMGKHWQYPSIHVVEVKAVPLKECDLAQTARYVVGLRNAAEKSDHDILSNIIHPDDGSVVDWYQPYSEIRGTLVGPNDPGLDHPKGNNSDFVYLYSLSDLEVYTFDFDISGLNFTYLSEDWTNNGDADKLTKSLDMILSEAQEAKRAITKDQELVEVPTLQGPETSVDKTTSGDLGTT